VNVLVLLAGIVDPNHRLGRDHIATQAGRVDPEADPRKLSPFDEAALEQALQLRDRREATRVSVALFGTASSHKLAQFVAALRPDQICRVDMASSSLWDAPAARTMVRSLLAAQEAVPDLVLTGREFGDCDNGVFPAWIAQSQDWAFVGNASALHIDGNTLVATRTRGSNLETIRIGSPALVSMVNGRKLRLRYPLLKNVMQARRESIATLPGHDQTPAAGSMRLGSAGLAPSLARESVCRMLVGSTENQAEELARFLVGTMAR
jgi:electron transfer flavoprotein beta subunit